MRSGALCSGLLVLLPQCNSYILGVHLPTRSLGVKSFMSTTAAAAADITQQKKHMREEVDARLQAMIDEDIDEKSVRICTRAYELAEQQSFTGAAIYLSMRKEVQSDTLAASLFRGGKRVFVPKIMGRAHNDLRMFEVCSMEQIAAFPKNKWNIPEPLKADVLASPDPIEHGGLDVVFMPGVAFDTRRARLGHGKAYYDCFLRRIFAGYEAAGRSKPVTIGLFFDEQEVENVPLEAHDQLLDYIVTPTRTFCKQPNP